MLKIFSAGSESQTSWFSHFGVSPWMYPLLTVMKLLKLSSWNMKRMKSAAASACFEWAMMLGLRGPIVWKRPLGPSGVVDVGELRREVRELALGHEVDAGAVQGRTDGLAEEGTVVAAVVPGEATRIAGLLPELANELEGLARLGGVDHDLARFIDLHPAEAPQGRVGEGRRVAEGVAERLAHREVGVLHLGADREVLLPGVRRLEAELVEDVLAVDDRVADVEQRHGTRDAVDHHGPARPVVHVAARELAHQLVVVGQAVGEQVRLVVDEQRGRPRRCRSRSPR